MKVNKGLSPSRRKTLNVEPAIKNGARYVQATIGSSKDGLVINQIANVKIVGAVGYGSNKTIVTIFNTEEDFARLKKLGGKLENKHNQEFAKLRESREKGRSLKGTGFIDLPRMYPFRGEPEPSTV